MLLGIGIVGFVMRAADYPVAPLIIGMVLGPVAETGLRDAMMSANGDATALVSSPITITLYALLVLVVIGSIVNRVREKRR